MSDAPERIWLEEFGRIVRVYEEPVRETTPYVRADLFDAQARRIEELEGALRTCLQASDDFENGIEPESDYWKWREDARAALSKGTEGK